MRLQVELAGEVTNRLAEAGVQGRTVTLKLKRKKEGAPEPSKFLGHGQCPQPGPCAISTSTARYMVKNVICSLGRHICIAAAQFQVAPGWSRFWSRKLYLGQ